MNPDQWHQRYQQQARWTASIRAYLFKRLSVCSTDQILEVGVGTGAVLSDLLEDHPFKPYGVDISHAGLKFSVEKNPAFSLVQADGIRLPFKASTFQHAFCHYLLIWVKDPLQILGEMRRVIQPGGFVIALAEPDHAARIDYPPPLDELGKFQTRALQEQGVDSTLGRSLRGCFVKSGLREIEAGILGAQWSAVQSQPDETEWMVLRTDLEPWLPKEKLAEYRRFDQEAYQNAVRVLFIPTFYAIGRVP